MNDETRAFSIGRERPFVFWEEHTVSSAMPFIIWRCMTELVTQMKRRFHFMHNYTREDILRLVEKRMSLHPPSVYRHLRGNEKYGCDRQPA